MMTVTILIFKAVKQDAWGSTLFIIVMGEIQRGHLSVKKFVETGSGFEMNIVMTGISMELLNAMQTVQEMFEDGTALTGLNQLHPIVQLYVVTEFLSKILRLVMTGT